LDEDKYEKYKEKVGKVWDKIKNYRKSGLEEEGGEFSIGNLNFTEEIIILKKDNGLKRSAYDKQFDVV
jgi:hypothetical protein